ncbi:dockerin type I repeat-containing protein [Ruminococcus sp.]|uniref:dockerin type I repeat-containing protein n=1 Tax=Ruminococcus sp. TaxID=41978 RepID=UPI002B805E59|nr:dockerin type I repeat-containing protein [Ruminococcus sp.]HNZ98491.1 dockerin type I repeat-containing protein [Ruminococcus sp.]HOH87308.1 dockerin type I repeat-containing protein [Ruminococcus sp.]
MNTKNRIRAFITAAVMAAAPMAMNIPAASAEDYVVENGQVLTLFGDVNFDGDVGISDAVQLNRYLLGHIEEMGNIKNADLLADGVIDVFDMVYLRKQLVGEKKPAGTKLSIKVVDMLTGEPLENATVEVSELNNNYLYTIGGQVPTNGEEINYYGLPDDKDYQYFVNVTDLPEGYDEPYKNWDQVVEFDMPAGTAEKELVIRVAADNVKNNVKITSMDWGQGIEYLGYGNLTITDKDGNYYYQRDYDMEFALPDGDYHADFNPFDYPVALVDPDSDIAATIKGYYPDATFEDWSEGIDFSVVDGKADRDLFINFGGIEGNGNTITVNCYDTLTGLPLEGVELTLIEAPLTYAKETKFTSDGTTKVFKDLYCTCGNSYKVRVDSVPEGYKPSNEEKYVGFGYAYNYSSNFNFYFEPLDGEKEISFNVLTWPDKQPYTGDATYTIYQGDDTIMTDVKPCQKIALKDGDYMISGFRYPDDDPYRGVWIWTELGAEMSRELDIFEDEAIYKSDMASFTVKNGKITKDITLYVGEKDKAMTDYEKELVEEEKRLEEEARLKEEERLRLKNGEAE